MLTSPAAPLRYLRLPHLRRNQSDIHPRRGGHEEGVLKPDYRVAGRPGPAQLPSRAHQQFDFDLCRFEDTGSGTDYEGGIWCADGYGILGMEELIALIRMNVDDFPFFFFTYCIGYVVWSL